ncbi:MAG: hypothetical protein HOO67_07470 [Candidatus Peribacteraceae bacterium]|nr:hypothetical protein [Candidatus Peribacteraceae bacterium]
MCLSPIGSIVADEWVKTETIRPYVHLDRWIIMPNHFHGIVAITGATQTDDVGTPRRGVPTPVRNMTTAALKISTNEKISPAAGRNNTASWKPGCLGSIINQFKSVCTKRIRIAGFHDFAWQPRYHDRIIRDQDALDRMRRYIIDNPSQSKHGVSAPTSIE